jgi:hypothetical protein
MQPLQGASPYTAPDGRRVHQTMALLISAGVEAAVRAQANELVKAGFAAAGEDMCAESQMLS